MGEEEGGKMMSALLKISAKHWFLTIELFKEKGHMREETDRAVIMGAELKDGVDSDYSEISQHGLF